jgi:Zn-dependent protease
MDTTYILAGFVIAFLILSLGVHEAAHAWVANLCGDSTAKDRGRLTLNPIAHIDPFMTVILPLVLILTVRMPFGGAKPVPVVASNLRSPLRDMMLVALAGPASNVLLAIAFMLAHKVLLSWGGMGATQLAPQVMLWCMYMNILLAVFNMIPVPPLDGSRVMSYILPYSLRQKYDSLERFGLLIVVAMLYFGVFAAVIEPTVGGLVRYADGSWDVGRVTSSGRVVDAPVISWLHQLTGGTW